MDRRQFSKAVAAVGLTTLARAESKVQAEELRLTRNGWMPNNERLPVLIDRRAFDVSANGLKDVAARMEDVFGGNGWPAQWRNGVYDFHHFHSTAHEVLGFAAGKAKLMLGGGGGHEVVVEAGDVAVLPCGTGHCRIEADDKFLVIGAYPEGQHWDICRAAPDEEAVRRMRQLRFPKSDPVSGAAGPLAAAWRG
ncbi:MAG TPA: cupin [Acidisarcina sp.]